MIRYKTKEIKVRNADLGEIAEVVFSPIHDEIIGFDLLTPKLMGIEAAICSYVLFADSEIIWQSNLIETASSISSLQVRFKNPIQLTRLKIVVRNISGTPPYSLSWLIEYKSIV